MAFSNEQERAIEIVLYSIFPKAFSDAESFRHLKHVELDLYRKARQPREQDERMHTLVWSHQNACESENDDPVRHSHNWESSRS